MATSGDYDGWLPPGEPERRDVTINAPPIEASASMSLPAITQSATGTVSLGFASEVATVWPLTIRRRIRAMPTLRPLTDREENRCLFAAGLAALVATNDWGWSGAAAAGFAVLVGLALAGIIARTPGR